MVRAVEDELARPRIGVVVSAGEDEWTTAVAARTVVLSVLRRLPRARVEVLVGGRGGAAAASPLDCGRPPRALAAAGGARQRLDLLLLIGEARAGGRAAGGCPVLRLPGTALEVAAHAAAAAEGELHRNRVATMRLLGWLPAEGSPHIVADADAARGIETQATVVVLPAEAGVDELVAAITSAEAYAGTQPLLRAIAGGSRASSDAVAAGDAAPSLDAVLDGAAAAAVECWRGRGAPGAHPDPAPARRAGAEEAALRIEIRRLERDAAAAAEHTVQVETTLRTVLGSRTWRYSESARELYHAARRRLQR